MKPQIANPHFARDAEEIAVAEPSYNEGDKIKIRHRTNSPMEEYAFREGETEKLDQEFLAMLCGGWRGVATCTATGIKVKNAELVGFSSRSQGRIYWHPDSVLCSDMSSDGTKVIYTFNPSRPDVIHLHTFPAGDYIETLPAKDKPAWFDNEALGKAARDKQTQIRRHSDRLQALHQEDSHEAVDQLSRNASEMDRVATTLDLPEDQRPREASDPHSPTRRMADEANRIEQAQERRREIREDADDAIERREMQPVPAGSDTYDPFDIE